MTHRLLGHHQEALADLDRAGALDLEKKDAWIIAQRGIAYRLLGCYREALADLDRAIALDERNDWYWYSRALIHLVADQSTVFKRDLKTAVELAQVAMHNTSDDLWIEFHLVLYNLVNGNYENAEFQYGQYKLACSSLPDLQDAVNELIDFLIIQPSNERAQYILTQLQSYISDLKRSSFS